LRRQAIGINDKSEGTGGPAAKGKGTLMGLEVDRHREVTANSKEMARNQKPNQVQVR